MELYYLQYISVAQAISSIGIEIYRNKANSMSNGANNQMKQASRPAKLNLNRKQELMVKLLSRLSSVNMHHSLQTQWLNLHLLHLL